MQVAFDASRATAGENHWRTLASLARHLWPAGRQDLKTRVVVAFLFLVLAKIVGVYVPFLYKYLVDHLGGDGAAATVLPIGLVLAYGGARVLQQGFGELRDLVFAKVSQHAQRAVGLRTFAHLHALSLKFHLERQTGGLSRVIERGTRAISFVLSFMLFNIIPTLIELGLVTGILLVKFDWPFGVVTFATIVCYVAFTLAVTEWRLKFRKTMNQRDSEANTKAIDILLNYETVKYFGNERHEYERFDKSLAAYESAAVASQSSLSMLNVGQGTIIGIGLVIVMLLAAQGVIDGEMTVGDFVLVNTFLIQLYLPLNFLGFVYREMKQSLINMDKMFELIAVNPDVKDADGAGDLQQSGGEVTFRDVHFSYDERRPVLKGVSFAVPAGKMVAIVGPSGSGKSTLSRLLYRFYDIQAGEILIDGQNIAEVTQTSLRRAIGIVPQDTVLFNDTIRYNIRYGRPDASDTEVEEAARLAEIHDFVARLPDGYQTTVGERGLKLSGGEKQRVAIARAILKKAAVLVFDEATSALDSHTEKQIQASLKKVAKGHTTLIIAHRLSTIVDAHEILVLQGGVIVERGRHDELLARQGEYASMWRRQQEAQSLEARLEEVQV